MMLNSDSELDRTYREVPWRLTTHVLGGIQSGLHREALP